MNTRPLKYDDLKVATKMVTGYPAREPVLWRDSSGRTRVHVSLIGASFVMQTFWIKGYDPANVVTRAVLLLTMQRKLKETVQRLRAYES